MKVTYVVPRYGVEVHGGAEHGARMLAERLVSMAGIEVEVLTSCAIDAATWAPHFAPGIVTVNGVTVRRFAGDGRAPDFAAQSDALLPVARIASEEDADRWIDAQGPTSPELIEALRADDADVAVFYPYLYYPTVRGVPVVGRRAVLHPAAHAEPPLWLPVFRDVFTSVGGLVLHTDSERRLIERTFPVANKPQLLLGLGVEERAGDEEATRRALGVGDRPFVLCVGRVDPQKGTHMLARYFDEYARRHRDAPLLVLAGSGSAPQLASDAVIVAGPIDDDVKWGAIRACSALISPSYLESFSIVLLEAWTAGRPVVVNALCGATREQVERSGGGFSFGNYGAFEVALEHLLRPDVNAAVGARGNAYVRANYAWPVLIERYERFLRAVAQRGRGCARPLTTGP